MQTPEYYSLPKTAQDYLRFLASKGRKKSTIQRYRYDLTDFYHYLEVVAGGVATKYITNASIQDYFNLLLQERNYNEKTIKRIYAVLTRYFSFLQEQKQLAGQPLNEVSLPEWTDDKLTDKDLFSLRESRQLLGSIESDTGLSAPQKKARPLLAPRNKIMISLLLHYGLRLQELHGLNRQDIHFGRRTLSVSPEDGEVRARKVPLSKETTRELNRYLKAIPKPLRPRSEYGHPLFIAFDFQKQTYRWSYENDEPKRLTIVAMQKMIRTEIKHAGLPPGRSAQHFRHTFIVRSLQKGHSPAFIRDRLGLHSTLVLERYLDYVERNRLRASETAKNPAP